MLAKEGTIDENTLVRRSWIRQPQIAGKEVFEKYCVSCHGPAADRACVGPNLTDEYWIHGGGITERVCDHQERGCRPRG